MSNTFHICKKMLFAISTFIGVEETPSGFLWVCWLSCSKLPANSITELTYHTVTTSVWFISNLFPNLSRPWCECGRIKFVIPQTKNCFSLDAQVLYATFTCYLLCNFSFIMWHTRVTNEFRLFNKVWIFKKLLHYECTSCQLTISSHQNMVGYLLHYLFLMTLKMVNWF